MGAHSREGEGSAAVGLDMSEVGGAVLPASRELEELPAALEGMIRARLAAHGGLNGQEWDALVKGMCVAEHGILGATASPGGLIWNRHEEAAGRVIAELARLGYSVVRDLVY